MQDQARPLFSHAFNTCRVQPGDEWRVLGPECGALVTPSDLRDSCGGHRTRHWQAVWSDPGPYGTEAGRVALAERLQRDWTFLTTGGLPDPRPRQARPLASVFPNSSFGVASDPADGGDGDPEDLCERADRDPDELIVRFTMDDYALALIRAGRDASEIVRLLEDAHAPDLANALLEASGWELIFDSFG